MKDLFAFFTDQSSQPGSQAGLPYWIFWFLLSIILLLIFFIFLRDKDLRHRINQFLFNAKQKLIKLRLQRNLNNEKRKKIGYIQNMGKTAWEKKIRTDGDESILNKLNNLNKKKAAQEKETQDIESKIQALKAKYGRESQELESEQAGYDKGRKPLISNENKIKEETAETESKIHSHQKELKKIAKDLKSTEKNISELGAKTKLSAEQKAFKEKKFLAALKELESRKKELNGDLPAAKEKSKKLAEKKKQIQSSIRVFDNKLHDLNERKKEKSRIFHNELKEWEKERDKAHNLIIDIEKKILPLLRELGELFYKSRIKADDLSLLYSQIDRSDKRIKTLEKQIRDLE